MSTSDFLGLDPHLSSPSLFGSILVDIATLTARFLIITSSTCCQRSSCSHAILRHSIGPTLVVPSFSGGAMKQNGSLPAHLLPYLVPSYTAQRCAVASPSQAEVIPSAGVSAASHQGGRPLPYDPDHQLPPLLGGDEYSRPGFWPHAAHDIPGLPPPDRNVRTSPGWRRCRTSRDSEERAATFRERANTAAALQALTHSGGLLPVDPHRPPPSL